MKKIISIFLVFAIYISCIAIPVSASETTVKITFVNPLPGNIYFDGATPKICMTLENKFNVSKNFVCNYVLKNEDGVTVYENSENVLVNAKTKMPHIFDLYGYQEYGTYILSVSVDGYSCGNLNFAYAAKNYEPWDYIGTQMHFRNQKDVDIAEITTAQTINGGIKWIREDLPWSMCETVMGEYNFPAWQESSLNTLLEGGNEILLTLGVCNSLYDADSTLESVQMPDDKAGRDKYKAFCEAVARHFAGRIEYFQIGNEPNRKESTGWEQTKGTDYGELLKAAYEGIKAGNPNAKVVSGPPTSVQLSSSDSRKFITDMLSVNGVTGYMDYFAFHPYNHEGGYSDEVSGIITEKLTFLQMVNYVKTALANAGAPDMPLWITEYGVSNYNDDGETNYTEAQQATDLVRTITASRSVDNIERFSIYNFHNQKTDNSRLGNYGLVDFNYNAEPAFLAVSFLNRFLNGAEYVSRLAEDSYSLWNGRKFSSYRFKKGYEDLFVIWEHTNKDVTLNISKDNAGGTEIESSNNIVMIKTKPGYIVNVYDMYGNSIDATSIVLSDEPVYVKCRPESTVIKESNKIYIESYSTEPGQKITMYGIERGQFKNKIVALNQTTSDWDGRYTFSTNIPSDAYYLYVVQGENKAEYGIAPAYDIDMNDIGNGEISVKITDNNSNGQKLMLFGAVYKGENELEYATVSETNWQGNTAILNMKKAEGMELMLFSENLEPITDSLCLE